MFIKIHGILGNRLIINVNAIKAFQEITENSMHAKYLQQGAKTLIQIDDKVIPIKNSIVQIENILKKAELVGGAS